MNPDLVAVLRKLAKWEVFEDTATEWTGARLEWPLARTL